MRSVVRRKLDQTQELAVSVGADGSAPASRRARRNIRDAEEASEEVRVIRRLLGLDQTGLARELGVTRQTVNVWESCRAPVPRVVRLALRLLLGNRNFSDIPRDDADAGIARSTSEAEQPDDRPHPERATRHRHREEPARGQ
jgi:DNA-binding transcriptional regulator YiaG